MFRTIILVLAIVGAYTVYKECRAHSSEIGAIYSNVKSIVLDTTNQVSSLR